MPEGPEVRRQADSLAQILVEHPIEAVEFAFEWLKVFEPILSGRVVSAVDTRGKAFLVRFGDLALYCHHQLYGRWMTRRRGGLPKTRRSLRVAIHTATHSALLYSAFDIEVLDEPGEVVHPYLSRLGPDLLGGIDPTGIADRLQQPAFRKRQLGTLYLDQGFLAGVGNYLRSEILFVAGVHPAARPVDLDDAALARLARASVDVTRQAYTEKGVTNDLERVAHLKAAGLTRRRYRHHVFTREGQDCWTCATPVQKMLKSGRRIYWCPGCQPEHAIRG
jgi:endonuclease-8